jgi:hypothetical protein
MPFNRIIRSAGDVIRFGNPELENHALDIALLPEEGKLVIEDRYGVMALDAVNRSIIKRWNFTDITKYRNYMSTYSGIKTFTENGKTWILWSVAERGGKNSALMIAEWNNNGFTNISDISFERINPAANALPND